MEVVNIQEESINHYNQYNHYNHHRDRDSDLDLDWGVVVYNQIVTWTAFAILAMFSTQFIFSVFFSWSL